MQLNMQGGTQQQGGAGSLAVYTHVYHAHTHVFYNMYDNTVFLWPAMYVPKKDACPADNQSQPGVVERGKRMPHRKET